MQILKRARIAPAQGPKANNDSKKLFDNISPGSNQSKQSPMFARGAGGVDAGLKFKATPMPDFKLVSDQLDPA